MAESSSSTRAATMAGSKWVPAQRRSSSIASGTERAGLGQDRVRYRHLPDVVQPAAELDAQDVLVGQAEATGDRGGQLGDLAAVRGQVPLAQVAADREGFRDVQALRLLGPQVGGIQLGEAAQPVAAVALGRVKGTVGEVEGVFGGSVAGCDQRR